MRFPSRSLLLALLGGAVLFSLATPATAAQTSSSEFVIIREGDVFPEDLYAGAIRVMVEGTLEGDLVAFSAEEIVIEGTVTGSVTAVTPRLVVNGEVGESVRFVGTHLDVEGVVGGDVVATALDTELGASSDISGDVLLWSWDALVLGTVGGDLGGTQRDLDLAGDIRGDVDVSVTRLTVVDDLRVTGDLGYRSGRDADGLERVDVQGVIVDKTPLPPNLRVRALGLLGRFLVILFLSVAALSAGYGWPRRTTAAIGEVGNKPIRKWLVGALVLSAPAIVTGIACLILWLGPAAAAFPLLVVLVPVILALVGLALALALIAGAPTVGWLGGVLFKRLDIYGAMLAGSLVVGVVWFLPLVGWLVPITVLPWGLGAWMATWSGQSSQPVAMVAATSLRT
jgi:cytoskeletal protein CcmA (bactofilin family)